MYWIREAEDIDFMADEGFNIIPEEEELRNLIGKHKIKKTIYVDEGYSWDTRVEYIVYPPLSGYTFIMFDDDKEGMNFMANFPSTTNPRFSAFKVFHNSLKRLLLTMTEKYGRDTVEDIVESIYQENEKGIMNEAEDYDFLADEPDIREPFPEELNEFIPYIKNIEYEYDGHWVESFYIALNTTEPHEMEDFLRVQFSNKSEYFLDFDADFFSSQEGREIGEDLLNVVSKYFKSWSDPSYKLRDFKEFVKKVQRGEG